MQKKKTIFQTVDEFLHEDLISVVAEMIHMS